MGALYKFYLKLSNTKAIEESTGKYEVIFFEHVHRLTYIAGFSSSDKNVMYRMYSWFVKIMLLLLISCEMWNFFYLDSLDALIDSINLTLIQFLSIYKFKCLKDDKEIFQKLASAMEGSYFDTSTYSRKKLLKMWTDRTISYSKLIFALGQSALFVWNFYPLVDDLEYNLAVAVRLPYEYRTEVLYPITYTLVQVAFSYVAGFVMLVDTIILTYLMHLLCQYSILADCFVNILEDCQHSGDIKSYSLFHMDRSSQALSTLIADRRFQAKYAARLRELVTQHIIILKNTMELRKVLSSPMLGQLAASGILISSVGFQVINTMDNITKLVMSLLFLGYNMCELYILCRWCDELKFQSEYISLAAYCSGWEAGLSAVPGVRARILFVITRAAKPLVITAGGMYDMSLLSFTSLVKASYSALSVLLRTRN